MQKNDFIKIFPEYGSYYEELDLLARLVEKESKKFNITAIRDYESIWQKHIIDSLYALKVPLVRERLLPNAEVLDIGTGAGFPGLPLSITNPGAKFTLIDGTKKKINVVNKFVYRVGLSNAKGVWKRAEDLSKVKEFVMHFDVVVARAVAHMPRLLELSSPFVVQNGLIVLYKEIVDKELEDGMRYAKSHNLNLMSVYKYEINGKDRSLLVYEKQ